MKKKIASLLLALVMCLGLLPVTALAAETSPPDWNFLVLYLPMDADYEEDGEVKHVTTSMSEEEVRTLMYQLVEFESVMKESGVMTPHFTKYVMKQPFTALLGSSDTGPCPGATDIASYLQSYPAIDLDAYDHVIVYARMDGVKKSYGGLTIGPFDNGTTYSFVPADYCLRDWKTTPKRPAYVLLHELLHNFEAKCGYNLHGIEEEHGTGYPSDEIYKARMLNIILNRVTSEYGSGVHPLVWQYPPHELRTMTELNIPAGVTSIRGSDARLFGKLTKLTIPSGVTGIGDRAFWGCTVLDSVTIPVSMTNIGYAAFWDTGVADVYYAGTEAQWKAIQVGEFNEALTNANIHYGHLMADVKATDWFAQAVMWAMEKGIASGTGEGTFSPNSTCTQGQILTFLWRAYGSPTPSGKVSGNEYYAVPLQWAKEQKLVDEYLSAKDPCTRANVVTYLWKLAGSPSAKAASFSDVPASASYAGAVNWAVENKITSGTSETTFSPEKTCTRGQIVTFLRQALAG